MARNEIMDLWQIPQDLLKDEIFIRVKRSCGHIERLSFDGIEEATAYHMPATEAARLTNLRSTPCADCEFDACYCAELQS